MVKIVVGGDVCPIGVAEEAFVQGRAADIFHDLVEVFKKADLAVANLECPLVSKQTPIVKAGPALGAKVECVRGFSAAGLRLLNLGNNHSFDHGAGGLLETMAAIRSAGLSSVGAGANIQEAQLPFVLTILGKRIVIYSMAEREFSVADDKYPGANPLDLVNFINAVKEHKSGGTFIVLLHGGSEFYSFPSPEMVKRCRFMVDMGADAVICCHTHYPMPWETYKGKPIFYGLGNLVFPSQQEMPKPWYHGYLVSIAVDGERVEPDIIPYIQDHGSMGARGMSSEESSVFFGEMDSRNRELKSSEAIAARWEQHCIEKRDYYLANLFGYNRVMYRMKSLLLGSLHSKINILRSLHLVQCESHLEVLNTIFRLERGRYFKK